MGKCISSIKLFDIYQTPTHLSAMFPSRNKSSLTNKPSPEVPLRDSSRRTVPFFRNVLRPRSRRVSVPDIRVTTPEGVEMDIRDAPPWREARPQISRKTSVRDKDGASDLTTADRNAKDQTSKGERRHGHRHRTSSLPSGSSRPFDSSGSSSSSRPSGSSHPPGSPRPFYSPGSPSSPSSPRFSRSTHSSRSRSQSRDRR